MAMHGRLKICCDCCSIGSWHPVCIIFIDRVALAKQGDYRIGSVRPSVRPFVCALMAEPFGLRPSSFALRLTLAMLAM